MGRVRAFGQAEMAALGYHSAMLTLRQLADALQAQYIPCSTQAGERNSSAAESVERVASVRNATQTSLTFAESEATLQEALASAAAAVLVTPEIAKAFPSDETLLKKPLLLVAQPRLAFAKASQYLRAAKASTGVHRTAILASSVKLAEDVSIGAYAVLGEHVEIGARTRIGAGCVLADGVKIGADCTLYPRVVIYSGVELRDRAQVHAGCVLGSDGFGYVRDAETGAYTQFPQQGTLIIEEDVEIGANTTIDRGALEETRIARGTKLDNLVHIGHNVQVGRNVVMAAQTGISGSSTVGHGAILGGQVGIGEHADVGEGVILGGGAGVLSKKKLRGEGIVFWGRPAQPLREYLKGLATLARLARKAKE
ncbi:MAG TPA: UDP-3-O-(3-hydroxymyristoyl)glucosamine N-acyltransferase [Acidobacteriaceae bacterium]|nr:UDP-3-O-(3-hydroxymyristoyl)glucosamine N-acyltransferase [Acidobacteriaceae bacterium]